MKQEVTELAQRPCSLFQILSYRAAPPQCMQRLSLTCVKSHTFEMAFNTAAQSSIVQWLCIFKESGNNFTVLLFSLHNSIITSCLI